MPSSARLAITTRTTSCPAAIPHVSSTVPRPDTLTLAAPVDLGRRGGGSARLALPLAPMYGKMRRMYQLLLFGAVGAGTLAIFIGLRLARHIARPLAHMTHVAEHIAAGDFE